MNEQRAKVSVLSLILAFAVQAVAVAWFLSNMHATISRVQSEQTRRTPAVWTSQERLSSLEQRGVWTLEHMKDLEVRLRKLERVQ
jgi:hypothetical protein